MSCELRVCGERRRALDRRVGSMSNGLGRRSAARLTPIDPHLHHPNDIRD